MCHMKLASPDILTILQDLVADGGHGELNLSASCYGGVQLALCAGLPLDSRIVPGLDVVQQLLDCVLPVVGKLANGWPGGA